MALRVSELYKELCRAHGPPQGQWKLWCKRPKNLKEREEVIIGAVLTQITNWRNVCLAIHKIKKAKALSLQSIYNLGIKNPDKLKDLIKSAGFYNTKARYLTAVAKFFIKNGGVSKISKISGEELRPRLLALPGVGYETCDSILLYALDKPVFVIDEYTRRLCLRKRLKSKKNLSYERLRNFFEENLPIDFKLYQDFHALIVINEQKKLLKNKNNSL